MANEPVNNELQEVFRILARHLDAFLEGDEAAFESLGDALAEAGATGEQLELAALILRQWGSAGAEETASLPAAKAAHRVASDEERAGVSPEAWGYLLALRQRGSLDSGSFERVVDGLMASGDRPAGLERARELVARVVLSAAVPGNPSHESQGSGH
jgi:uncharacterized protein Smg (DUF494 family)